VRLSVLAACLLTAAISRPIPSAFHFQPAATPQLHQLWSTSSSEKAERVACLAAKIQGDTVQISDVLPLGPAASDSLGVSAASSLEECGPPRWLGTIHTHIALKDGQRPYSLFSGADRGVMMLWWQRWEMAGVFCLLYSEKDVICEIEGPEGAVFFPRSRY
jgi:hypothetical protein